jgi:hypothetical protein
MDSKGNLVPAKLKEAFVKPQGPVDTKDTDREMLVDACIAKDGEFRLLYHLHLFVTFLNWWTILFTVRFLLSLFTKDLFVSYG